MYGAVLWILAWVDRSGNCGKGGGGGTSTTNNHVSASDASRHWHNGSLLQGQRNGSGAERERAKRENLCQSAEYYG